MPEKISSQVVKRKLVRLIDEQIISGAVWGIVEHGELHSFWAGNYGITENYGEKKCSQATVYDLASLTKIVGTTTRILQLVDQGLLALTTKVAQVLPEYRNLEMTILDLLTHTSGLPADFREKEQLTWEKVDFYLKNIRKKNQCPLVIYSDIGYLLLGLIIEKIDKATLAVSFEREIFTKLKMKETSFSPANPALVAPTELQATGKALCGLVHDQKARRLLRPVGSAGLFAPINDLLLFAQGLLKNQLANGQALFSQTTLANIRQTNIQGRSLGWEWLAGTEKASVLFHTGFTGTAIGLDFEQQRGLVVLTNRVHPSRVDLGYNDTRLKIYQDFFKELN